MRVRVRVRARARVRVCLHMRVGHHRCYQNYTCMYAITVMQLRYSYSISRD